MIPSPGILVILLYCYQSPNFCNFVIKIIIPSSGVLVTLKLVTKTMIDSPGVLVALNNDTLSVFGTLSP